MPELSTRILASMKFHEEPTSTALADAAMMVPLALPRRTRT